VLLTIIDLLARLELTGDDGLRAELEAHRNQRPATVALAVAIVEG
jgi:hypothetical protein